MTFNPHYDPQTWLKHLLPDPRHGALYPYRMLAGAFGVRVDQEAYLHQVLAQLTPGQHFQEHLGRTFITLAGLYAIADVLGTSAAQLFKQALIQWQQTHKPFGDLKPTPPPPIPQPPALPLAPTFLQPPQPSVPQEVQPLALLPPSHPPNAPSTLHPVAQELAIAMRPEIERAVQAAVVTNIPSQPRPNETLEALKWQREADLQLIQTVQGGLNESQQTMASATQQSVRTTADAITQVQVAGFLAETRRGIEIWLEGADFPTLAFVSVVLSGIAGLFAWGLLSLALRGTQVRPTPSIPQPALQTPQIQPFRTQEQQSW